VGVWRSLAGGGTRRQENRRGGLDVYENEPFIPPRMKRANVVWRLHLASARVGNAHENGRDAACNGLRF